MRVRVRLFAAYREIVGARELSCDADEGQSLEGLLESLFRTYPRLGEQRATMMLAVNQTFVSADARLRDGDEVALLPPVSGGVP